MSLSRAAVTGKAWNAASDDIPFSQMRFRCYPLRIVSEKPNNDSTDLLSAATMSGRDN